MSPSQQFLRFAADCQSMAKLTGTDLSAVRSGLNAKASRQRKLNFEGANRGPNSDNPISIADVLSPSANRGSGRTLPALQPHHVTITPSTQVPSLHGVLQSSPVLTGMTILWSTLLIFANVDQRLFACERPESRLTCSGRTGSGGAFVDRSRMFNNDRAASFTGAADLPSVPEREQSNGKGGSRPGQ